MFCAVELLYFCSLCSMLDLLPCATVARMESVGHPLHTQEKEPVLLAIEAFLYERIHIERIGKNL